MKTLAKNSRGVSLAGAVVGGLVVALIALIMANMSKIMTSDFISQYEAGTVVTEGLRLLNNLVKVGQHATVEAGNIGSCSTGLDTSFSPGQFFFSCKVDYAPTATAAADVRDIRFRFDATDKTVFLERFTAGNWTEQLKYEGITEFVVCGGGNVFPVVTPECAQLGPSQLNVEWAINEDPGSDRGAARTGPSNSFFRIKITTETITINNGQTIPKRSYQAAFSTRQGTSIQGIGDVTFVWGGSLPQGQ